MSSIDPILVIETIEAAHTKYRRKRETVLNLQLFFQILFLAGIWGMSKGIDWLTWVGVGSAVTVVIILVLDGAYFFPKAQREMNAVIKEQIAKLNSESPDI